METTPRSSSSIWARYRERHDLGVLLARMPPRWRALLEALFVVHALLGVELLGHWFVAHAGEAALVTWQSANLGLLVMGALVVLRPVEFALQVGWLRGGALALGAVLLTSIVVLAPRMTTGGTRPRVGILLDEVNDAEVGRKLVLVTSVMPATPASGHLRAGDRIAAVLGEPLDEAKPAADFLQRAGDPERWPSGPVEFEIWREGKRREVTLELPPPATSGAMGRVFRITVLRNLALLTLLGLFLARDGQGMDSLGIERDRFWVETRVGVLALAGLMVGHFLISVLVSVGAMLVGGGILEAELAQRQLVTGGLLQERLPWMIALVLVASTTEEVVFRGFLLPRLRHVSGSWIVAVVVTVLIFGAGHTYEGTLATIQTAGIALMLSLVFLWRRHLMPCIFAHVGFNTLALVLAFVAVRFGLFDQVSHLFDR